MPDTTKPAPDFLRPAPFHLDDKAMEWVAQKAASLDGDAA